MSLPFPPTHFNQHPLETRLESSLPPLKNSSAKNWGYLAPKQFPDRLQTENFIQQACQNLAQHNYPLAIAPLDRNTWHEYRCIIASNGCSSFFLEPQCAEHWHISLKNQHFQMIAHYISTECTDLSIQDPRWTELRDRFTAQNLMIQSPQQENFENELKQIYEVAIAAFKHNFLFTPIPWTAFQEIYKPLIPLLNLELVFLAKNNQQLIGFLLGIPDYHDPSGQTVILKTVAVQPNRKWAGLGRYLVALFHQKAMTLGYQRVIHALMNLDNYSYNLSRRYQSNIFREYGLFAKPLKVA